MFGFSTSTSIDVKEAYEAIGKYGHILIDVRSQDEVKMLGIKGAVNIPLEQLEQAIEQLSQYDSIHVVCRSGGRSSMATQMLNAAGIKQAKNVSGGLIAWERAGLPTT